MNSLGTWNTLYKIHPSHLPTPIHIQAGTKEPSPDLLNEKLHLVGSLGFLIEPRGFLTWIGDNYIFIFTDFLLRLGVSTSDEYRQQSTAVLAVFVN